MNEFELIATLKRIAAPQSEGELLGIGDDAAVLPLPAAGGFCLISTDSLLEGRHFSAAHLSGEDLGWKLLAVSVSDLIAMGASPQYALVNLHLPEDCAFSIEEVYRGLRACGDEYGCVLVGGDTVRSKEFALVSTVLGHSSERPWKRSDGLPGDQLWVSAPLGAAALGLQSFSSAAPMRDSDRYRAALRRPRPPLQLMRHLREHVSVNAAIDVSDGLLQDLGHIACASKLSVILAEELIPAVDSSLAARLAALTGGDDYQLAFTLTASCEPELASKEFPAVRIGVLRAGEPGVFIQDSSNGRLVGAADYARSLGAAALGYTHF